MVLVAAEGISKSYADRQVLQDIRFSIHSGDKIGVIGINGTGKTTLLKLIAGLEQADEGQLLKSRGLRIEYLPQQPEFPEGATVLQAVLHGQSPVMQLIRDYETASARLQKQPENPSLQQALIRLSEQMDAANAWNQDSDVKNILTRLGIHDYFQPIADLSGGQKKRVALAAALANPADLLILDEPTNHIDPAAIAWLEQYLSQYAGALLMVTHDRYFLERVTQILLEIDQTHLYRYEANYAKWLELKAARQEEEQAGELKRQNLLRRELAWIRRGAKARSTKQKARIDRFQTLSEREAPEQEQAVTMTAASSRLGRKTLILDQVSKRWAGKTCISDFSYIVDRRERLGLIGPNGCGKTTLLNIIAGILAPDSGSRDIGSTVRIGFFTQENEPVDPDLRIIDAIRQTAEVVKTKDGELSASQMLERFLFPPALQWTQIGKLSGGEKRRLFLLKVLMSAPNLLLLDEPSNDLDIMTLSVLENYLEAFPGAVIVVSHDRYFLDRVVQRILSFEPDGHIRQSEGNFQAWLEHENKNQLQSGKQATDKQSDAGLLSVARHAPSAGSDEKKPVKLHLKFAEKKDLETIDQQVAELETAMERIKRSMEEAASDYVRLQALTAELEETAARYETVMNRWLYLQDLVERINQQA